MLLCGCLLAGFTACADETVQNGGMEKQPENQVTNIPVENPADDEQKPEQVLNETVNLMDGIELMSTEWSDNFPEYPVTQFGVPLLQNTLAQAKQGENVLISPMSAWTVLCMVEAGAQGETKKQMQDVLAITEGDYLTYAKKFTFLCRR